MTQSDQANDQKSDGTSGVRMVRTLSAEQAVTAALRTAILSGRLAPGQRLAQAELAEQLGVSRIPLRDALRRLEEEALVKIDGRRGAWVTVLSMRDVAEIYEMRIMLEARCVRYAVENLTDEDVARLVELWADMDRPEHDAAAGRAARRAFYGELYAKAKRPRMARLILQLRDNVGRYHVIQNSDHSHVAHAKLRHCIEIGDASGAIAVVTEHLEEARDDLLRTMADEFTSSSPLDGTTDNARD
jgi:DNA-binding GntR family transcriptional regulator